MASPLSIGDIQLDDAVKSAFSRQLLRMYLERQIRAVARMHSILGAADVNDSSCRITRNLFVSVLRRSEFFLRVMNLTDKSESPPVDLDRERGSTGVLLI
jgi:hypothetical protein